LPLEEFLKIKGGGSTSKSNLGYATVSQYNNKFESSSQKWNSARQPDG